MTFLCNTFLIFLCDLFLHKNIISYLSFIYSQLKN